MTHSALAGERDIWDILAFVQLHGREQRGLLFFSFYTVNIHDTLVSHTDLVVVGDEAVLAHINTMFEAEQIGHLSLRTLAETHGRLRCIDNKLKQIYTYTCPTMNEFLIYLI